MEETAKYLIRADVTADGVVERSDVVGAIFGQTEGLLGQGLDLRDLQQSSKVGRIDVDIRSQNGQSFGEIVIASGLDRVETAILAAGLETIERVGPCRSTVEVERIEDVRAAKRREVVERATGLLGEFDANVMSSEELVETVREHAQVEEITEYEGLPAGPRVAESDAVIVVEGRADVLTLLRYGVKNAIAVEGTNVPEAVAALTRERTTTAFPDGDRGGDLILKELAQVGEIDYVAAAPEDHSVEDLDRRTALAALREKVPYGEADSTEHADEPADGSEGVTATDGSARPAPDASEPRTAPEAGPETEPPAPDTTATEPRDADAPTETDAAASTEPTGTTDPEKPGEIEPAEDESSEPEEDESADEAGAGDETGSADETEHASDTLYDHVRAVIGDDADLVRLLDADLGTLADAPAEEVFDAVAEIEAVPTTVVLDGELTQRVLDVAAQRGVERIVARAEGEFVKQPTAVQIRTAEQLLGDESASS